MTSSTIAGPSILFCPANRPDRYVKAIERADAVILDLEDAVTPQQKSAARQDVLEWCNDPANRPYLASRQVRVILRINPTGSEFFRQDIELLNSCPIATVMLPKVSSVGDIEEFVAVAPGIAIVALCETPSGIARSLEIAQHPAVTALMWGAEDLMAALGGSSSRLPDGRYRDVTRLARATVLLNATACGKDSIDSIYADFSDAKGVLEESRDAAASGFTFKASIHPSQCTIIREAYAPSETEIEYAIDLLKTVRESRGAVRFRGTMVDDPLIKQAEHVMDRANVGRPTGP